jgi:hypothetical protein
VQAGDGVKAGDSLTESFDTIEINSFNHSDDIPGITLHRSMLGEGYRGSLTFINDVVPLQIKDGQYKFKLFGYPADEKRFWNNFYQNLRQNKIDPHDIFSFAAIRNQINPFRFLVDNALKYHFTFITVKNVKYPTAITLSDVSLQKLLPPWNGLIIQVNADLTGHFRTAADDNDSVTAKKFITLTGNYQPAFAGKGYLHKI